MTKEATRQAQSPSKEKSRLAVKAGQSKSTHAPKTAVQRPAPTNPILHLQTTIGNLAVQRLLRSGIIQAKPIISQPGDKYEREANRVADDVMRISEPAAPEQGAVSGQEQDTYIQRMCPECEEELHAAESTSAAERRINALRSGGQRLSESARQFVEPRFGRDFSQVRIHTDDKAADSAQAINAAAYTMRNHIVFAAGQYAPETTAGKRLLAHELTHVVQQAGEAPSTERGKSGRECGSGRNLSIPEDRKNIASAARVQQAGASKTLLIQRQVKGAIADASKQVQVSILTVLSASLGRAINALAMSPPDIYTARNEVAKLSIPYRRFTSYVQSDLARANESITTGKAVLWGRGLTEATSFAPSYAERRQEAKERFIRARTAAGKAYEIVGDFYSSASIAAYDLRDRAGPNMKYLDDDEARELRELEYLEQIGLSIRRNIYPLLNQLSGVISKLQAHPVDELCNVGGFESGPRKILVRPKFAKYMGQQHQVFLDLLTEAETNIIAGQTLTGYTLPDSGRNMSNEEVVQNATAKWIDARSAIQRVITILRK